MFQTLTYRSADTVYAKQNGGQYDFYVEDLLSLPIDEVTCDY